MNYKLFPRSTLSTQLTNLHLNRDAQNAEIYLKKCKKFKHRLDQNPIIMSDPDISRGRGHRMSITPLGSCFLLELSFLIRLSKFTNLSLRLST